MTPAAQRSVKPMPQWALALVPKPTWKVTTNKAGEPDVEKDTIPQIKKIVHSTLHQTRKLAAKLKANTLEESTHNVWKFVFDHIKYVPDANGDEELREPSHTIHAAKGDCDCMTILISSLLLNMQIAHRLRIMKQHNKTDDWGHIYIVVPKSTGHITIDCVAHAYNYEAPHVQHKDFTMSTLGALKTLSGTDDKKCNGKGTRPKQYARTQQFRDRGMVITEEFLLQNKIPFTVVDDGERYGFVVGRTFVPPVITKEQAAMLMLPEIQNPPEDVPQDPEQPTFIPNKWGKCLLWALGGAAAVWLLSGDSSKPNSKAA